MAGSILPLNPILHHRQFPYVYKDIHLNQENKKKMGEGSDRMQSRTRFFDMNNDCISLIFSLISPQDLCSASRISKHFKLASESDTVWENILP